MGKMARLKKCAELGGVKSIIILFLNHIYLRDQSINLTLLVMPIWQSGATNTLKAASFTTHPN
jgi:hypothetical protein